LISEPNGIILYIFNLEEVLTDTLFLYRGRSICEFLDPGLFEIYHRPTGGQAPGPFLQTGPEMFIIEPLNQSLHQQHWVFWLIFLGFALLAMTRHYYQKRLQLLFSSLIKRSAALQIIRESPVYAHQSFIPLFLIYVISFVILTHLVMGIVIPGFSGEINNVIVYLQIAGFYLLAFLAKIIFIYLISVIFRNRETGSEYIQTIVIFNLALGIILLSLSLLISYTYPEIFLYITAGVALMVMLLRLIRGVAIGLSDTKYSMYHLFLYLCTLEILPMVFAAKFFSKYFFP